MFNMESENAKLIFGNDEPLRQKLSYLDVIFPHIRIVCDNFEPSSNRKKSLKTKKKTREKTSPVNQKLALNNQLHLMEVVQNSFFNFPSALTGENNALLSALLRPNDAGGRFFFQQMQKTKRNRTTFSTAQLNHLEQIFKLNHYVVGIKRKNLANCLKLSETQTEYFTRNKIVEFRQCFELYAENGLIKNDVQLRYIMRSLGYLPTVAETTAYIKELGNRLNFVEFLNILQKEEEKNDPFTEIKTALYGLNSQKSDYISRRELTTLLSSFGEKLLKTEIKMVLSRMGLNTENISIEELVHQLSIYF